MIRITNETPAILLVTEIKLLYINTDLMIIQYFYGGVRGTGYQT